MMSVITRRDGCRIAGWVGAVSVLAGIAYVAESIAWMRSGGEVVEQLCALPFVLFLVGFFFATKIDVSLPLNARLFFNRMTPYLLGMALVCLVGAYGVTLRANEPVFSGQTAPTGETVGPLSLDASTTLALDVTQRIEQDREAYERRITVTADLLDENKDALRSVEGTLVQKADFGSKNNHLEEEALDYRRTFRVPSSGTYHLRLRQDGNVASAALSPIEVRMETMRMWANPFPLQIAGYVALFLGLLATGLVRSHPEDGSSGPVVGRKNVDGGSDRALSFGTTGVKTAGLRGSGQVTVVRFDNDSGGPPDNVSELGEYQIVIVTDPDVRFSRSTEVRFEVNAFAGIGIDSLDAETSAEKRFYCSPRSGFHRGSVQRPGTYSEKGYVQAAVVIDEADSTRRREREDHQNMCAAQRFNSFTRAWMGLSSGPFNLRSGFHVCLADRYEDIESAGRL